MRFKTQAIAVLCVCRFLNVKEVAVCSLMWARSRKAGGGQFKGWMNPAVCFVCGREGEVL